MWRSFNKFAYMPLSILSLSPFFFPPFFVPLSDTSRMLEISDTGLCTRHGLQVFIHPDDAKDRVLMAIVEALLERNNLPTSTKELASLIIQEGYTRLG